jgi:predicted transposase YbfD/YdcC
VGAKLGSSEVITITIIAHFASVPDPRGVSNARHHDILDILGIALCAVICGADGFTDMEQFGLAKEDWLRDGLGLSLRHGIPSHDTFGRVFAALDTKKFGAAFQSWTQEIARQTQGQVIAVDGKTLRRSFDSATGRKALHMVSAWASENRLVLAQEAVQAKSNEITAVPALLKLLDLNGAIVTVDALNCQKEVARQIVEQGGDYVFALKDNHRGFHEDVVGYFEWALKRVAKGDAAARHFASHVATQDFGHGRSEKRRCWCVEVDKEEWPQAAQWHQLRSLIMVESERRIGQTGPENGTIWSESSCERRFYLASIQPNANRALNAVREHWGIENSVHWVLDVAFNEDACRIRKENAATNMATLRHLTLNILRLDKSLKKGLKAKRLRAGWDINYLKALLAQPNS